MWTQVGLPPQGADLSDDACPAVAKAGVRAVASAVAPVKVAATRIFLPDASLRVIRFNEHPLPNIALPASAI
jgi:hypothetical protein